ncbi:MAG: hypothetical protein R6T96_09265, partial [Longimicrobiales bacterium]
MKPSFFWALVFLTAVGLPSRGAGQEPDPAFRGAGGVEGLVSGRQRSASCPLPHVLLELSRGTDYRTAATDSLGRYRVQFPCRIQPHTAMDDFTEQASPILGANGDEIRPGLRI